MINVVAAVIADESGKILITQRNLKKSQGGLWEFPGGKIEPNETREDAIIRELKEELNIDVKVEGYLDEKVFNYPEKDINLIESGLLDSYAFILLFSTLEDYGVFLEPTRIDRSKLATVSGIQEY